MLWLAHDGSLNSDWLSHYAVRFASHLPERAVRALFVEDGSLGGEELDRRLEFLERECAHAHVAFSMEHLTLRGDVAKTLIARIPAGPQTYVLSGTRVRQRNLSFLRGTVSERLLAARRFNVLAVRIVEPGRLGVAHRVLVPVMGHPRGFSSGIPFLELLGEDLQRVHVLLVRVPARLGLEGHTSGSRERQQASGARYVEAVMHEIRAALPHDYHVEASVVSSTDPAAEIVLAAKQHRSDLIYLGASERGIAERLLSGMPSERVLRHAPCDVAIYRGLA